MIFDHTIVAGVFTVFACWFAINAMILFVMGKQEAEEFGEYLESMPDLHAPAKAEDISKCVKILCMRVEAQRVFRLFLMNASIAFVSYASGWLGEAGGIVIW